VAAAVITPLVFGGLRSLVLLVIGVLGLGLTLVGLWWALTHHGVVRIAGIVIAVAALVGVAAIYIGHHFFWIVVLSAALWSIAYAAARASLRGTDARMPEYETPPPRRPFIIMNPRSGGGKVDRFDLVAKAEALGARVVVLDGPERVDVAELARGAVAHGADLLGEQRANSARKRRPPRCSPQDGLDGWVLALELVALEGMAD
jgi:hypothetical protein